MKLLVKLVVNTLAVFVAAYLLPHVAVDSFFTAFIVSVVLGILNTFIKPIILILTLPITILTLGLFTLVINTIIVLVTSYLVNGFLVDSFLWAFLFSVTLAIISSFFNNLTD